MSIMTWCSKQTRLKINNGNKVPEKPILIKQDEQILAIISIMIKTIIARARFIIAHMAENKPYCCDSYNVIVF